MFTFGAGQPNSDRYMFVEAADEIEARARVVEVYGTRWSWWYPPDQQAWVNDTVMAELAFGSGITLAEADRQQFAKTLATASGRLGRLSLEFWSGGSAAKVADALELMSTALAWHARYARETLVESLAE